jgi:hypothetical protein
MNSSDENANIVYFSNNIYNLNDVTFSPDSIVSGQAAEITVNLNNDALNEQAVTITLMDKTVDVVNGEAVLQYSADEVPAVTEDTPQRAMIIINGAESNKKPSVTVKKAEDEPNANFDIVVDIFEWGSAVTSVIIDAGTEIDAGAVDLDSFSVSAVTKNPVSGNTVYEGPRTITNAYVSEINEKGTPAESGRYIVLELKNGYNATQAEVDGSAALI